MRGNPCSAAAWCPEDGRDAHSRAGRPGGVRCHRPAAVLSAEQRSTAYAVAAEIMRSDGHLQEDEQNILDNLEVVLELNPEQTAAILRVMNILHSDLVAAG